MCVLHTIKEKYCNQMKNKQILLEHLQNQIEKS
jgi:hypothetical protein